MSEIEISCDRGRLDLGYCYDFIANSYWSRGRSRGEFDRSVEMSVPVGAYCDGRQVGFARVVTDFIAIAYIADVFVDPDYRRRGIASMMLDALHGHPDIARVKRWMLATHDMQPVYRQHGYEDLNETIMMRLDAESDDREPLL
ncbi:GNAT family N-acetyltransferase [Thalassospira sp. MCCC 1A03138]|uniref:GNAT family N-acetyltransferase n=1 Tax=Thalassospira sp. MCCC 1A03138 TaxID=1470576 RepID=UPI000A1D8274|nr:GNAT family N-acetyltransferase [Thalassospira sp. MCCC 1A03138]OSQ28240.1 GCN5 family acetyltransferase [Thalassospira sp. MCCC 1A03138]